MCFILIERVTMKLEFGDMDLIKIKRECDEEYKKYGSIWKQAKFWSEYKDDIDRGEYWRVRGYIDSIRTDMKQYGKGKNIYEVKRLYAIAVGVRKWYVGNVLAKKYYNKEYVKFGERKKQDNILF